MDPLLSVLDNIASVKQNILNQKKINNDKLCKISNIELQLKKIEEEHNKFATDKLATITKTNALYEFQHNTNETVRFLEQQCTNLNNQLYIEKNKTKEDKNKYDEILSKCKTKWTTYKMIYLEFPLVKQHQEQLALLKLKNFNIMLVKQRILERKEELRTMENIIRKQLQLKIIHVAEIFVSGVKLCREKAMVIRDIRKLQDEVQKMKIEKEKLENMSSTNAVHTIEESTDLEMVNAPQNLSQGILASFGALTKKNLLSLPRRAKEEKLSMESLDGLWHSKSTINLLTRGLSMDSIDDLWQSKSKTNLLSAEESKEVVDIMLAGEIGSDENVNINDPRVNVLVVPRPSSSSQLEENIGDGAEQLEESIGEGVPVEIDTSDSKGDLDLSGVELFMDRPVDAYQTPYPANVLSNSSTAQLSNSSSSNNSNKEWQHLGISTHTTDSTQNINIPEPDFIPSRKCPRLSKELFHDNILTSTLYKSAMEIEHRSSTGTDDNADSTLMETTTHIQTQESETTHQAEDNDLSSCTPTSVPNEAFDDLFTDDSRQRAYLLNLKTLKFQCIPRKLVSNSSTKHINKEGNVEPDKNQNVGPTRITQETSTPMQTSTYNVIVNTTDDTEAHQTATREIMKENNTNLMAEDYQKPASKTAALINNDANESSDSDFPMMFGIQTDNSFNMLCLSPDLPEECADSNFLGVTASNAGMTSSENGFPSNFKLPPIPAAASLFGGENQPAGHVESSHKTTESFFDFDSKPTSGPSNVFQLF